MRLHKLVLVVPAVAAVAMLSACGGLTGYGADENKAAPAANAPAASAPASDGADAAAPKPQTLKVSQVDGFTPFVTNAKGRTIYRFDKDSADPSKTTCLDKCAQTWEPVLAGPGGTVQIVGEGLAKDQIGLIERPEGQQVTLNGWPLYYFKTDKALGQTEGHGKNGTWFAIAPDGKKAAKQSGGSDGDDSYGY